LTKFAAQFLTGTRTSIRARFAYATAGLIAAVGALMVLTVYLFMRYVPNYQLTGVTAANPSPRTSAPLPPVGVVHSTPVETGIVVTSEADVLRVLLICCIVALVVLGSLGAWASWLLAGRMLQPLRALGAAAEQARMGSLSHRIHRRGPNDELQTLSDSFDDMLDQIERTLAVHQRFAANASHELRTPLSTTKALLQVAQSEPNPPGVTLLLERLTETNERLIETTSALLDLATSRDEQIVLGPTALDPIVDAEIETLADEIAEKSIRVDMNLEQTEVLGDTRLLRLLVGNLLRNAVRHNRNGGDIGVTLTRSDGGGPLLIIENSGNPVSADALVKMTEPFYRARGRTVEEGTRQGHGLGLAIVANIAEVHEAELRLEARAEGGMRVVVSF
jgi:two-component system sensor histidine kinase VanS